MKVMRRKLGAMIVSVALITVFFSGCTVANSGRSSLQEQTSDSVVENENVQQEKFRASNVGLPRQEKYEYPYMGLSAVLPESLMKMMDERSVIMYADETTQGNNESVGYAQMIWSTMDEVQREEEVEMEGSVLNDWVASLERIGTLGVYRSEFVEELDELTGCTEHTQIGQSVDGVYKYYLSVNTEADPVFTDEVKRISTEIIEMLPYNNQSAFDTPKPDFSGSNVGAFQTTDITGKVYTQDVFAENDLTLVNIFTTWCTPCVEEIPHLQKLSEEMAAKGVGVVGVVMDTVNSDGTPNEEALKKSSILAERTGTAGNSGHRRNLINMRFVSLQVTFTDYKINGKEVYYEKSKQYRFFRCPTRRFISPVRKEETEY